MMEAALELRLEARPSPPSERRRGPARVSLGERWQTSLQDERKPTRSRRQPRTATANTDSNGRDRVRHNLTSRHLCLYLI